MRVVSSQQGVTKSLNPTVKKRQKSLQHRTYCQCSGQGGTIPCRYHAHGATRQTSQRHRRTAINPCPNTLIHTLTRPLYDIYIYLSCKTPNITTKPYCNPSCMDTPVCTHLGGAKVSEQPQLRSHRQQSRLRPQLARVHVPLGPSDRRQKDRVRGLRWTRSGGGGGSEAQQRVCDQVSKHKRSNRCTTIRSQQVAKTQPNPT